MDRDALLTQPLGLLPLPAGHEPAAGVDHPVGRHVVRAVGQRAADHARRPRPAEPVRQPAVAGHPARRDGAHERPRRPVGVRADGHEPKPGRELHAGHATTPAGPAGATAEPIPAALVHCRACASLVIAFVFPPAAELADELGRGVTA